MQNKSVFFSTVLRSTIISALWMSGLLNFPLSAFPQDSITYENTRARLVKNLKTRFIDKTFTQSIDQFYFTTCDSLINEIAIIEDRPIRDILIRLFIACDQKLYTHSISLLRIPSINNFFLLTLQSYQKQPINKLFRQIGVTQTSILQYAFDGLLLGDSIKTFAELRQMVNFPYLIASRILDPRYTKYKDTLLYFLANGAPDVFVEKLGENDSAFVALVKKSNNNTVKAVAQLKKDYFFDIVFSFTLAILEKKLSKEEVIKLTLSPCDFYHVFTNEAIRLHTDPDPQISNFLKQPIIEINKDIAYNYFIDDINNLHDSPDIIRFQCIANLSVQELYFILIAGNNQLYTSSFLYVYKRFLKETEKNGLEKFFDDIGYYQFDQFVSNISVYGLVNDLVSHLKEEKFAGLLIKYLTKLQNTQLTDNEIILNGMTMSEVLYDVSHYSKAKAILINELEKPVSQYDALLQRMYEGLLDILLDKKDDIRDRTYDILSIDKLKRNGIIVQAWFFYDDEDACASFANGLSVFNSKNWKKTEYENYIVFRSIIGNKVKVYMNKPKTPVGFDYAQQEMLNAIKEMGYTVTSFIHRGHSYHFYKTLSKMTGSGQFVFLGSCGGYNEVLKIFQLNPDMHLIVSRHMGSKLINDRMLEKITGYMVNNKDINWDVLWKEFNVMFRSKQEKDLFSAYMPPNKYTGVKFMRKVFNY